MVSILQRNWLIASRIEKEVRQAACMSGGLMLDAGCGDKPYKRFFEGSVDLYVGMDMPCSPLVKKDIEVFGSVLELPFKKESFSTILCTEVLQLVPEPKAVMEQFYHLLKKGGILILSTTQMWHNTNVPRDYYRFTEYGLRYLAESAGFRVSYHKSLGSIWARMGLKFCYFVHKFARTAILAHVIKMLLVVPQLFFLAMDRVFFDRKDVMEHFIILTRPQDPEIGPTAEPPRRSVSLQ